MANNSINWLGNNVIGGNNPVPGQQGLNQPNNEQVQNLPPNNLGTTPDIREGPPPISNEYYIPGYMVSLIGKTVRAEFFINNAYLDKVGVLEEVGVNYFVLHDTASRNYVMCDLYSVKFVTVLN